MLDSGVFACRHACSRPLPGQLDSPEPGIRGLSENHEVILTSTVSCEFLLGREDEARVKFRNKSANTTLVMGSGHGQRTPTAAYTTLSVL